jgi:two-component sensor histidine kinase
LFQHNILELKKTFFFLVFILFGNLLQAQALQMVERSWEIFGENMDSAKILVEKGYYEGQQEGDLKAMGRALCYRAVYYDIETVADSALFLFYKAIDLQESISDTNGLVTTYNNLGIFHFNQYQYTLALVYYKKAYETAMLLNDYGSAAGSLVNMGIIESYEKGGGKAINYYAEAERLYMINNDTASLPQVWTNLAKIYFDRDDYQQAYQLNLKSIQSPDEFKTLSAWVTERILMTNILTKMQRYQEAEKYGLEALQEAEKNHIPERKQYVYEALSNLYYQKNEFRQAYDFSTKYRDLRDSLVNDVKAQQIASMETANKVEKKNNEITLLKLEAERKKNIELEKNRLKIGLYSVLVSVGIGLVVVVILIILLINNLRLEKANSLLLTDKKNHTEALLEKEKLLMRESHHRIKNNLQLINSILDLQSRNIQDPAIKKVFTESRQRIQAISFAHQRLYGNDTVEKLNLKSFINDLVQSIQSSSTETNSQIRILSVIDDITISTEKAVPIGLIVNELLTNAIKYAFEPDVPGEINIHVKKHAQTLELVVADNGKGMVEGIQGTGFGHQLVKSMTRQLKAEYLLSLTSGVEHRLMIPI